MSEKEQEISPKAKQYLLMIDEVNMMIINKILPSLMFVEVEGVAINGSDTHIALASPKK